MKLRITKTAASVSCVLGVLTLMMGSVGVNAKLSPSTGTIEGRAPTATGTLSVLFPDGATSVTNNAVVNAAMKPSDFKVSTSVLTLQDLDGDTGLSSSLDTAAVTWVWTYNGIGLTSDQLAESFSANFSGKTLTVSASAPVTVSSLTGAPTTSGPQPLSSATYSLVVPVAPTVRVNGASFAINSDSHKPALVRRNSSSGWTGPARLVTAITRSPLTRLHRGSRLTPQRAS
ncbi:hypothetical protein [Budvicia aquatica]|uniref:Uncharacterized protein n=1 Tax=Budvicia aquatica TaxID=82979 RepID=A0A484ZGW9_9GAMM|nr:hypothetical protein [Budvicia aquatica]VFS47355.1 Uncharacterised protein [Budvicia aquatica]